MDEAGPGKRKESVTAHDAEGQLMAPGRQLMAENDRSWGTSLPDTSTNKDSKKYEFTKSKKSGFKNHHFMDPG
jgi:hypothetical protein